MSGIEVLGAISATLSILEVATSFMSQLRKAYESQAEFGEIIRCHQGELERTRTIIKLIEEEESLRTASVSSAVCELELALERLTICLRNLSKGGDRKFWRRFSYQLLSGPRTKNTLVSIMGEVSKIQSHLGLQIQLANVGLTVQLRDKMCIDTKTVQRVDCLVRSRLGEGYRLRIATLTRSRPSSDDGIVTLSPADVAALEETPSDGSWPVDERSAFRREHDDSPSQVIIGNLTWDQAIQINGPVGARMWREGSRVAIKDNAARGSSVQVNHVMSQKSFDALMASKAGGSSLEALFFASTATLLLGVFVGLALIS